MSVLQAVTLVAVVTGGFHRDSFPPRVQYAMNARLLPDSGIVVVRAELRVPAAAVAGRPSLAVDLEAGSWSGHPTPFLVAKVSGVGGVSLMAFLEPDGSHLDVPLRQLRRSADQAAVITLEYRAALDSSARRQVGYWLFGGADGHVWYPTFPDLQGDFARFFDFDVTIDAPQGIAVLATGEPVDGQAGRGTPVRYRAQHIEGFALAFDRSLHAIAVQREGISVVALAPDSLAGRFRLVAEEAADAAAWYRQTYGFFPLARIGIVPGSPRSSGGYPLPGIFMVHLGNLTRPFIRAITAHELGHYYWGLWVLEANARLDWLTLANGIWADQYQLAQRESTSVEYQWRRSPLEWLQGFFTAQVGNYDQRLGLPEAKVDSLEYDYNTYVRHCKGATGLYLVSRRLGWEKFLQLQRDVLRDFRDRPLPADTFVARVMLAGYPDAGRFFAAWMRGDARLGYQVSRVTPSRDPSAAVWIVLEKTGTVSYPVDVAVRSTSGAERRVSFRGDSALDSMLVQLDAPFASVAVDPDGALPMWNSSHPEIRRLYIAALDDAGQGEAFEALALRFLAERSDPELRARLVSRRFALADYRQAVELAAAPGDSLICDSRWTCRAKVLEARALTRLGDEGRAAGLLNSIRSPAADNGAERQWRQAWTELSPARR